MSDKKNRRILTINEIIDGIDAEKIYTKFGVDVRSEKGGELFCICPFHSDTNPSLRINQNTKLWKCFSGCGGGNLITFVQRKYDVSLKDAESIIKATIHPPQVNIEQLAYTLANNSTMLDFLRNKRGLTDEAIRHFRLGYNGDRITIPIYIKGVLVNVKYYLPGGKLKFYSHFEDLNDDQRVTYGEARLFPYDNLSASELYIFEGEMDAMLACSLGFPAITNTTGAGTFFPEWAEALRGKSVVICYDNDLAGRDGATKAARALFGRAKSVKVIALPGLEEKQDFTDYIMTHGHTAAEFAELVAAQPPIKAVINNLPLTSDAESGEFQPEIGFTGDNIAAAGVDIGSDKKEAISAVKPINGSAAADSSPVAAPRRKSVIETNLRASSRPDYAGKRIKLSVMVSGKDLTPFIVPRKFTAQCTKMNRSEKDLKGRCYACGLSACVDPVQYELTEDHPLLLKLIKSNDMQNKGYMRELVQIPKECKWDKFEVQQNQNVEEVRVIPELEIDNFEDQKDIEYTARIVYSLSPKGERLRTNASYAIEGVSLPRPSDQYATILFSQFENKHDDISSFEMTADIAERLKIFQPAGREYNDLDTKIKELYRDLSYNITKIYDVNNIIQVFDWTMFSALDFKFLGDYVGRGYVESIIVGDTATGKSKTVEKLWKHYKAGEMIVGKNTTFAGLIGGISQISGKFHLQWGKWPLNDRRALIIDEFGGMNEEIIGTLTAIRSSGIVEINKVITERTHGRVRLVGLANPRSGDFVNNYNYGILILKHLIGKAEDIRRFDCAVIAGKDEYKISDDEIYKRSKESVEHIYTAALNNLLIRWAWSRTRDNIVFTDKATKLCLQTATWLSEKYSPAIPLVEPAEQRIKVARLAVATAIRMFSTENGEDVIVEGRHVEYVFNKLTEIFNSPSMAYDLFSKNQFNKNHISDDDFKALIEEFKTEFKDRWQDIRDVLLDDNKYFKKQDLTDVLPDEMVKRFLKWARNSKLMRATSVGYQKTPIFTRLLRHPDVIDKKVDRKKDQLPF